MNTFWQHQYLKLKNAVFPPALIVLGPPPRRGGIGGKYQASSAPLLREDGGGVPAVPVVQPTRLLLCKQDRTLLL